MLVLDMIYLDCIVKKEKSTGTFEMFFSCFGHFGVRGVTGYDQVGRVCSHVLSKGIKGVQVL